MLEIRLYFADIVCLLISTAIYSHVIVDMQVASYKMEMLIASKLSTKKIDSSAIMSSTRIAICMKIVSKFTIFMEDYIHTYFALYS